MRIHLLLLALGLLCASVLFAGEKRSEPDPRRKPATGQTPATEIRKKQPPRQERQPTWPRPYRPSEEIRVDSVVPFPVDI